MAFGPSLHSSLYTALTALLQETLVGAADSVVGAAVDAVVIVEGSEEVTVVVSEVDAVVVTVVGSEAEETVAGSEVVDEVRAAIRTAAPN